MTVTIPESITAEGNVKVSWVPAIASLAAATTTELNAGVDITCYLPEAWGGITGEQAKGTQTRMCSKETFESFGRVKRGISDFTYTYLAQALTSDVGNKVKTAMASGTDGFIVVRYAIAATTAWTITDKYDAIPARTGVQIKIPSGADEFAPLVITQSVVATGLLVEGVIAA
jgi:hypothetical protein